MSTNYFGLKAPFTNVTKNAMGGHTSIGIWVNHSKAGVMIVKNIEVGPVLSALFNERLVVMRSVSAGKGRVAVTDNLQDAPSWTPLLSEYGGLVTAEKVRALVRCKEDTTT